jgi:hypothetical protein
MKFGVNHALRLSEIYHYKPSYIQFLIKYIPDFEISVDEFLNLPNPIIAAPAPLPPAKPGGLRFTPNIILKASVAEMENPRKLTPFRQMIGTFYFPVAPSILFR